ncbi:MAG: hypothetical protein GX561_14400 [Lentisphaerae bacterium]|jgi:uncharacterized protein (TIGR02722 family)|nr:hypothetical protein [Lentisphaerota bacterium]
MKTNLIYVLMLALLFAGCSSTTIIDPETTRHGMRQTRSISSEEIRIVAEDAVKEAQANAKFQEFMAAYKVEMKDPKAIPVLKLDRLVNDTDDPDLNVTELTDIINTAWLNANIVNITMAEGAGKTGSIAGARAIQDDPNFDQTTTATEGTLIAARLVLRPRIISNQIRDGRTKSVTRTFVLEMADIRTGLIMWKYTRQLGFLKKKGILGL